MIPASPHSPIPAETVRRAQAADPHALSAIYERYSAGIYRYIYFRVGGDPELARDLHADVFLRMLEAIGSYEDRGWSIGSWLYRIAHDRTIDTLRRRGRQQTTALDDWSEACAGPEEDLERNARRETVRRAIAQLPETQRRVLTLRFLYDLSLQDTADQMGRSVGSVKALQHRAQQALARLLPPGYNQEW
jgi:RNA polymerase sigma-70 factor (ECF subfamily)